MSTSFGIRSLMNTITVSFGLYSYYLPLLRSMMRLLFLILVSMEIILLQYCLALVTPTSNSLYPQNNDSRTADSTFLNTSCANLMQDLRQPCWDELGMSLYLDQWWEEHESVCAAKSANFTSCYQQLVGIQQQQCGSTGPSMCSFPMSFSRFTPQQAYTLYTIFGIWQWFESIYEGIENADVSAQGPMGKIETTINPEEPSTQILGTFLQTLSAITPTIGVPAKLGEMAIKQTARNIETALRQSPGVLKQLNPSGTLDSEFSGLNDLYDGLGQLKTSYQANVSKALSMIQSNFSTFTLFAANGSFIEPRPDLQAQTTNLTMALTTNAVASALTGTNTVITLARETDPNDLAKNGTLYYSVLDQCDGYDEYGVCGEWWYDPDTNAAFSLYNIKEPQKSHHDLLVEMFSSGWTTGEELFLGAKSCADYQAVLGGSNTPALDPATFTARCISNTQICVWDQSCVWDDPDCLFTGEYGWGEGGSSCSPPKE